MSSIDERVVEMKFKNSQFKSGVKESLDSLSQLKKGLDLSGAAKGIKDVENAGKSFSLASMASAVENVSSKFNALGAIGFTVLQNLTNSAINAGTRIASALTIDPIKAGFSEYETQMNSIQTIIKKNMLSLILSSSLKIQVPIKIIVFKVIRFSNW